MTLVGADNKEPVLLIRSAFAGAIELKWQSARQLDVTLVDLPADEAKRDVDSAKRRMADVDIKYFLSTAGTVRPIS